MVRSTSTGRPNRILTQPLPPADDYARSARYLFRSHAKHFYSDSRHCYRGGRRTGSGAGCVDGLPDATAFRRRRGPTRRCPPEYRSREPCPRRRRTTAVAQGQETLVRGAVNFFRPFPGGNGRSCATCHDPSGRVQPLTRHSRSAMATAPACETLQPRRDRSAVPRDRRG